jgi:MYXO-CTERM domain-containing protein
MGANDYHLISNWRVPATREEVYDIVADSESLAKWWPAAFLDVLQLEPGDETGTGRIVRLETKGYLPYKLHWHLKVNDADRPNGFDFNVWGDFEGFGRWAFTEDDGWTNVNYDWHIAVKKPIVRYLSYLARPLFISNHRWAMARGEESLRLEVARRRVPDDDARASIPPPPGPVKTPWALVAGLGAAVLGLVVRLRRRSKGRQA